MTSQNRRDFLKRTSLFGVAVFVSSPLQIFSQGVSQKDFSSPEKSIKFIFSSDLNLRNSPTHNGMGGLQAIRKIYQDKFNAGVLLDAGDFLSTDKNFTSHKEFLVKMNEAGYHSANIGHNELKFGEEYLASLIPHINFNLLNCNYTFQNNELREKVKKYHIISVGNQKVGITGVGPKIAAVNFENPHTALKRITTFLKNEEKVDVVICLSHLPYKSNSGELDNFKLASLSENVDFIMGGHFGNYINGNLILKNISGKDVTLCGGGMDGLVIGELEIELTESKNIVFHSNKVIIPGLQDPYKTPKIIQDFNSQLL